MRLTAEELSAEPSIQRLMNSCKSSNIQRSHWWLRGGSAQFCKDAAALREGGVGAQPSGRPTPTAALSLSLSLSLAYRAQPPCPGGGGAWPAQPPPGRTPDTGAALEPRDLAPWDLRWRAVGQKSARADNSANAREAPETHERDTTVTSETGHTADAPPARCPFSPSPHLSVPARSPLLGSAPPVPAQASNGLHSGLSRALYLSLRSEPPLLPPQRPRALTAAQRSAPSRFRPSVARHDPPAAGAYSRPDSQSSISGHSALLRPGAGLLTSPSAARLFPSHSRSRLSLRRPRRNPPRAGTPQGRNPPRAGTPRGPEPRQGRLTRGPPSVERSPRSPFLPEKAPAQVQGLPSSLLPRLLPSDPIATASLAGPPASAPLSPGRSTAPPLPSSPTQLTSSGFPQRGDSSTWGARGPFPSPAPTPQAVSGLGTLGRAAPAAQEPLGVPASEGKRRELGTRLSRPLPPTPEGAVFTQIS
ncbi:basic salivary proline-rich protein 2-like [Sarcophilus harrisii]|uniref:basic salivary proline-rich protein 2-like n=1 Tax=Sarcophilus harrisii TaxID=9305 RepID=UPI001301B802|nr:basic salivary proline-rich protein 2-like [Sarcophilus harrisii]